MNDTTKELIVTTVVCSLFGIAAVLFINSMR